MRTGKHFTSAGGARLRPSGSDLRRALPFAVAFALPLSFALVVGERLRAEGSSRLDDPLTYALVAALAVPLAAGACGALLLLASRASRVAPAPRPARLHDRLFLGPRGRLLLWCVLLVAWLPAFLAFWPGNYGFDAPFQSACLVGSDLSSHHPVVHTLWLAALMQASHALCGLW